MATCSGLWEVHQCPHLDSKVDAVRPPSLPTMNNQAKGRPCVGTKTTLHSLSHMEALGYAAGMLRFPYVPYCGVERARPKRPFSIECDQRCHHLRQDQGREKNGHHCELLCWEIRGRTLKYELDWSQVCCWLFLSGMLKVPYGSLLTILCPNAW